LVGVPRQQRCRRGTKQSLVALRFSSYGGIGVSRLITRGPLIVRDVDVLAQAARRASVSVTFSVPTVDDEVWRRTEPGTPHPRQRLRALKTLVDAGIKASVGMAPILSGISSKPSQLAEVVKAAREAGACGVWTNLLFLRPGTREHFLETLARDWPEELDRYERLYARRAYLGKDQTKPVRDQARSSRRNTESETAAASGWSPSRP